MDASGKSIDLKSLAADYSFVQASDISSYLSKNYIEIQNQTIDTKEREGYTRQTVAQLYHAKEGNLGFLRTQVLCYDPGDVESLLEPEACSVDNLLVLYGSLEEAEALVAGIKASISESKRNV